MHWLIWVWDPFPNRSKVIWLIMCLFYFFFCKTVLDNFIKVWKENSYPKGHWVEEATPGEHPMPLRGHLGRAAVQAALLFLQVLAGVFPSSTGMGGRSMNGFHTVLVGRWGGVSGQKAWTKDKTSFRVVCFAELLFFHPFPTVLFPVTSVPSIELW